MPVVIGTVVSLLILILVGVYGSWKNIITSKMNKDLTKILIDIALPFMIVSSFIFTYDNGIKSNIIKTLYYSLIAYPLIAILSYILLLPVKNDKKTILHFANIFTNTGYVGFPILNSIYGPEGVIYGSIFNLFFVIFVWTYGLMLFQDDFSKENIRRELKKIIFNPSIIAVILGLMIMTFQIPIPSSIQSSIESLGGITVPLSMMIVGTILAKINLRDYIKDWTIYYGITLKSLIIPILIYFVTLVLKDSSKVAVTIIIMSAMPASTMTSILAETFNKEKEYAAIIVSITTLAALITVPLLLKIIL